MKHLILILSLLFTLSLSAQQKLSAPKVWNFRTSTTEGRKPINDDFYGKTVYCESKADSLLWIRVNNVITEGYRFFPYSETVPLVHNVVATSNARYNAPYYQNSVKTIDSAGFIPAKINFTSPNTLIINWADSTAFQLVRGVVTKTWRIFPYSVNVFPCTLTYSAWSACAPNGLRTRTLISKSPTGCLTVPVLTEACTYIPDTCTITYSAWSECSHDGVQTRTVVSTSPIGCSLGTIILTRSCEFIPPACIYTYSDWTDCVDNVQTRTVIDSTPYCVGTPVLSQACETDTCTFVYSAWSSCVGGLRTRTVISYSPGDCTGTPILSESCTEPVYSGARNFYVSNSGSDSYTATQAHSSLTPWRTIAKVNSYAANLLPGDSILFKSGDTFTGTLIVGKSGTLSKPIVFRSYGIGSNPIITGFSTVTGWTNLGGNIWESSATTAKTTLNLLTVNGVNTPMGRYPNSSAANGGYLSYESSATATNIVDNQLSGTPNWTGAEVVVKKNAWVIDRCLITNHTGTSITFSGASGYVGYANWGYFIQNDIRTLDSQGEWFLNKTTKKVSIYSTVNPATLTVKIPVYDTLIYASSKSYITFSNIVFEGGNVFGAYLSGGTDIKFLDCTIRYIGRDGIKDDNLSYLTVNRCTLSDINDNVIYGNASSTNAYVGYSTITRSAIIPGNSGIGDGHNFGVSLQGSNSTMEYCNVSQMGYLGMVIAGNNALVRNNVFDSICLMKDDGSAIYVSGALVTVMSNRIIRNNIISNSIGSLYGKSSTAPAQARGIYVDGTGNNVLIDSNTVYNCTTAGVYLGFYTYNITLRGNTLYNNTTAISITENDNTNNNFVIEGNILATTTNQDLILYQSSEPRVDRPISSLGTWSGNYYIKPFGNKQVLSSIVRTNATRTEYKGYTTAMWASYDATMHFAPFVIVPYTINSYVTTNQYPNGTFNANITGLSAFYYSGSPTVSWDNTNQITAGTAKLNYTTLGTNNNTMAIAVPINTVTVGKKYIAKFDIKSTIANKAVDVHLRNHASPYGFLMASYNFYPMSNTATTLEVLLEPTVTANADLWLQVTDADVPFYIDNVEFREVNVTKANPEDHILFEYATSTSKTIPLTGVWKTLSNVSVSGSVTIAPFSSILLIK